MSQSLKKGIETLQFLASRPSAGVTELAEHLAVHKSTAFRILDTLLETNMVEKNAETLKYKLGPAVLWLSEQYYKNFDVITQTKPILERLTAQIHESTHLCVQANNSAVIVAQTLSNSRLLVNAKVGNSEPLHCSSVGKCLLAFAAQETREKLLDAIRFDVFTKRTLQNKQQLQAEIETIRRQGFAVDNEELSDSVKCVAVPVFDAGGSCVYSLGASGAASRMTQEKIDRLVPLLLQAAKDIYTV